MKKWTDEERLEVVRQCDKIEGAVWRVERKGVVDFLAKYVRHGKVDGKYIDQEIYMYNE